MSETIELRPLGKIVRLQIQRSPLIHGTRPNRYYDPAPLLAVDELTLTPEGAIARLPDGGTLLDIHHARHPQTRNDDGVNSLSVGFTSHYMAMREKYGEQVTHGCAGENILVESDALVDLGMLRRGLAIEALGAAPRVWLSEFYVAHPCEPFSRFASRATRAEALQGALQFLDDGIRGFYCALAQTQPATLAVGDRVLIPQA